MTANNSRRYPARPVLGVGALIFDGGGDGEAGKVLLVERGREPLAGYWSLPGGCVETGEGLEEAVVREVLEETGLQVQADSIAAVFERLIPDTTGQCEYHYVLVDFYCSVKGGDLRPGDDSSQAEWFAVEDLPALRLTGGTLEVIGSCARRTTGPLYVTRP